MSEQTAQPAPPRTEPGARRAVRTRLVTRYGHFTAFGYRDAVGGHEQMALVYGRPGSDGDGGPPLVRLHSECLTGDVFTSTHCECGDQLEAALRAIVDAGAGVLVYLRGHEGRGIGLVAKLEALRLQDHGLDTVEANLAQGLPVDARDYRVAAEILLDLGVTRCRLMSNNPAKVAALTRYGVAVAEQVALLAEPTPENVRYLHTKRDRMHHRLPHLDAGDPHT